MSACSVEVIKLIGKYLNTPVGTVCYNTDKVLTTVLDKQNVEGFATIVLRLAAKSGVLANQEQTLLCFQWLEHIAMYANQAAANPTFAKNFLEDINKALERNTYLTGQFLTIADVAVYYALYPLLEWLSVIERESLLHLCRWSKHVQCQPKERLSVIERESLLHLCRWSKHVQCQPKVCASRPPLHLNTLTLSILAPAAH